MSRRACRDRCSVSRPVSSFVSLVALPSHVGDAMPEANRPVPREFAEPAHGRRLIVRCDRPGCDHAALMDPHLVFGARRNWPAEGRTGRFRCRCGSREAVVSYTRNAGSADGPISPAAIALWY